MATPAVTGSNVVVTGASAASISLTAPTREANNLLAVELYVASNSKTPSTPSGWTSWSSAEQGTELEIFLYGRIADGTATDNFSSSWTGSVFRFGEMRRITGNDPDINFVAVGTSNGGSGTKPLFKDTIAPRNECLGLGFYNTVTEHELTGTPSGWEKDGAVWCPAIKRELSMGATGDLEGTFAASEIWVTKTVIIPPPPRRQTLLGVGQ